MDSVSPITSNPSTTNQVRISDSNSSTVDYDAFLTLLVTQLRNQDPTEPTDNAELMAQLASFSSVEQQVQINEKLEALISSNVLGDASSLIGKTVTSPDGTVTGKVSSIIIASDGVVAELEDGTRLAISPGTVITDPGSSSQSPAESEAENSDSGDPVAA